MVDDLTIQLSLPPSKNKRKVASYANKKKKTFKPYEINSEETNAYRKLIWYKMKINRGWFETIPENTFIKLICQWHPPRAGVDVHNFHDELADSIESAVGINDKWFLFEDLPPIISKNNPRVVITFHKTSIGVQRES